MIITFDPQNDRAYRKDHPWFVGHKTEDNDFEVIESHMSETGAIKAVVILNNHELNNNREAKYSHIPNPNPDKRGMR